MSSEEDDIEEFEDPHDNVNNDFLGDGLAWDNQSIASSAIFPSQHRGRDNFTASTTARPESAKARSRSHSPGNGRRRLASSQTRNRDNSNEIENLVRERAGVESGKDSVGPPIADCIAELLKSYLKDPNAEATKTPRKLPSPS